MTVFVNIPSMVLQKTLHYSCEALYKNYEA